MALAINTQKKKRGFFNAIRRRDSKSVFSYLTKASGQNNHEPSRCSFDGTPMEKNSKEGLTGFEFACKLGEAKIVSLFLEHGMDVDPSIKDHLERQPGKPIELSLLIKKVNRVHASKSHKLNKLRECQAFMELRVQNIENNGLAETPVSTQAIAALAEASSERIPPSLTMSSMTLLEESIFTTANDTRRTRLIADLLKSGTNLYVRDALGRTMLHRATEWALHNQGTPAAISTLFSGVVALANEFGAGILEGRDNDGNTPFMYAFLHRHDKDFRGSLDYKGENLVELFILLGAKIDDKHLRIIFKEKRRNLFALLKYHSLRDDNNFFCSLGGLRDDSGQSVLHILSENIYGQWGHTLNFEEKLSLCRKLGRHGKLDAWNRGGNPQKGVPPPQRTPLMYAVVQGDKDMTKALLTLGGSKAFQSACYQGRTEIIQVFLDDGFRPDIDHLIEACKGGIGGAVKLLISCMDQAVIFQPNSDGHTVWYEAVLHGRKDVIAALAEKGNENIDLIVDGKSPLGLAFLKYYRHGSNRELLDALLAAGADVNAPIDTNGNTILHRLVANRLSDQATTITVEAFITSIVRDLGASLEITDREGKTAFMRLILDGGTSDHASSNEIKRLIVRFLRLGAKLDANMIGKYQKGQWQWKDKYNILSCALASNNNEAVHAILSQRKFEFTFDKIDVDAQQPLITALGRIGDRIHTAFEGSRKTLMHLAALARFSNGLNTGIGVIAFLPTRNVDVNAKDKDGNTPLILAAKNGRSREMIASIINSTNCDISATDNDGRSVLHYFCRLHYSTRDQSNDERSIIGELIRSGADPEARETRFDRTPLLHAAEFYCSDRGVQALLELGEANVNVEDKNGHTVLHIVCCFRGVGDQTIQMLFDHGADLNARDPKGNTPLMVAFGKGLMERLKTRTIHRPDTTVKKMIELGANLSLRNRDNHSALVKGILSYQKNAADFTKSLEDDLKLILDASLAKGLVTRHDLCVVAENALDTSFSQSILLEFVRTEKILQLFKTFNRDYEFPEELVSPTRSTKGSALGFDCEYNTKKI